jgi:hypothetical protein
MNIGGAGSRGGHDARPTPGRMPGPNGATPQAACRGPGQAVALSPASAGRGVPAAGAGPRRRARAGTMPDRALDAPQATALTRAKVQRVEQDAILPPESSAVGRNEPMLASTGSAAGQSSD